MSENLYPARLKQKVTVAQRSQTNRSVFSARLNRSVDKSAEHREDGEAVPDPGSSDSETPITECTVGASNNEHRSIRRSKRVSTGVRDELTVVSKVRWQLTKQRLMDQQRQLELYALPDR